VSPALRAASTAAVISPSRPNPPALAGVCQMTRSRLRSRRTVPVTASERHIVHPHRLERGPDALRSDLHGGPGTSRGSTPRG
jgi:hypothetical protein